MELVKNPCLHFVTCNKLVANQYQFRRTTFVLTPLMRKNEVKLYLFSSIFKLVADLWSLFSSYDQHHMLEDDEEKTIGVKKINKYTIVKITRKDSNVDNFVSKIEKPLYDKLTIM
jgi:hypothetical protein